MSSIAIMTNHSPVPLTFHLRSMFINLISLTSIVHYRDCGIWDGKHEAREHDYLEGDAGTITTM
jgi:hypothetical protein